LYISQASLHILKAPDARATRVNGSIFAPLKPLLRGA
jgi:hypothetical protein